MNAAEPRVIVGRAGYSGAPLVLVGPLGRAVSGAQPDSLLHLFPATPGLVPPPGGARMGGGKGSLSQRPRSRKTGRSHLPVVGVPEPAAQAGVLLHPLTVTSDGIYGEINQRQACLTQPVTAHHALCDVTSGGYWPLEPVSPQLQWGGMRLQRLILEPAEWDPHLHPFINASSQAGAQALGWA